MDVHDGSDMIVAKVGDTTLLRSMRSAEKKKKWNKKNTQKGKAKLLFEYFVLQF